jgi:tRNA nucleotidyltransferase (CCA-adding enzyme)
MSLEEKLIGWTGPSSSTEQEKQDRTERMIRQAINSHAPFNNCSLNIYAKGSYANNTNVRSDSDVDIAVECTDVLYWEESEKGIYTPGSV